MYHACISVCSMLVCLCCMFICLCACMCVYIWGGMFVCIVCGYVVAMCCLWYVCMLICLNGMLLYTYVRVDIYTASTLKTSDSVFSSLETVTLVRVSGPSCSGW